MSLNRLFCFAMTVSTLAQILLALAEVKVPSTDFFVFKEAGVNLALHGRFTVMNLPHMQPEEEHIFSYYPPAYPFIFGTWSKAFGVGLLQSNTFDLTWRILRTVLLFLLVTRFAKASVLRSRWLVAFLFVISFISTDADRPDELAMCFALSAFLFLRSRAIWLTGILLGLAGATSPTCGVFAGVGLALLELFHTEDKWRYVKRMAVIAVVGVTVFFSCSLPVILADPYAYYTFSRQVPMSTLPYLAKGWANALEQLAYYLRPWFDITLPYVFAVVSMAAAASVALWYARQWERRTLGSFYILGWVFVALIALVWTRQPYYLWFPTVAFLACALVGLLRAPLMASVTTGFLVAFAILPLAFREAKNVLNAAQRPVEESSDEIRKRVLAYVGEHERLAITPDQYFTFHGYREIANLRYMCDRLDAFDYLYVTRILSARRDGKDFVPIPCESPSPKCFDPIADFTSKKIITVLGTETSYYVRGAGGTLYQNRRCRYSLKKPLLAKGETLWHR